MTKLSSADRDLIEASFYLPMVLKVLERDRILFTKGPFKLPAPYLEWLEETMLAVQRDLTQVKKGMREKQMKVVKEGADDAFTHYLFIHGGYEEKHSYFNPRLRNHAEDLMRYYLYRRLIDKNAKPPSTGLKKSV